jgi:hypothetical protein
MGPETMVGRGKLLIGLAGVTPRLGDGSVKVAFI